MDIVKIGDQRVMCKRLGFTTGWKWLKIIKGKMEKLRFYQFNSCKAKHLICDSCRKHTHKHLRRRNRITFILSVVMH